MSKKRIIIILFYIFLINLMFADNFIDLITKYSKLNEFKMELNIKFEVDSTPTSILMDLYVNNFKYFYFKISKPTILSGVEYYYNLHKDEFLTELKNDVDKYNGVKNNLEIFRNFINVLSITYSRDKFFVREIDDNNNKIYYYYPKSKTALKFLGVDYTQMKIFLKKELDNYILEKIEFFNSNSKKVVIIKVNIIPYDTSFIKKRLLKIQK
ncbi:hypothetical protein JCM30566_02050 [Marinitoga arctica]